MLLSSLLLFSLFSDFFSLNSVKFYRREFLVICVSYVRARQSDVTPPTPFPSQPYSAAHLTQAPSAQGQIVEIVEIEIWGKNTSSTGPYGPAF